MKKALTSFLQTSSAHGLRYLTGQNGILIRLLWLTTIMAFILCTVSMIRQNVQENLDNPIATTTKLVPVSTFTPPTITLTPADEPSSYLNKYQVLEQTLNNFAFDCIGQTHAIHQFSHDSECLEKSLVVRAHFHDMMSTIFENMMFEMRGKFLAFDAKSIEKRASRFLCNSAAQIPLGSFLFTGHDNQLKLELTKLFRSNFLNPEEVAKRGIKAGLAQLQQKYLKTNNDLLSCFDGVKNASKEDSIFLLSLLMTVRSPNHGILPLGTAMRILGGRRSRFSPPNKELLEVNDEIEKYFQAVLAQNDSSVSHEHMELLNRKSFDMKGAIRSDEEKNFYYRIAQMFATNHGLEKSLLPAELPRETPIIWACFKQGQLVPNCFKSTLTYTTNGLGISMNAGDWKDLFKMEKPIKNSFYEKRERLEDNVEITIYIQSFGAIKYLPYR